MAYTIFVSTPMAGKEDLEIFKDIERIRANAKDKFSDAPCEIHFLDNMNKTLASKSILEYYSKNAALYYLGRAISILGMCDACVFGKGWENARGCQIEHEVCEKYGIKIVYEEETV